jgi:hypothetical protein
VRRQEEVRLRVRGADEGGGDEFMLSVVMRNDLAYLLRCAYDTRTAFGVWFCWSGWILHRLI